MNKLLIIGVLLLRL